MITDTSRVSTSDHGPAWVSVRARFWTTLLVTTRMNLIQSSAYLINIIRMPLGPLVMFGVAWFAYGATGRESVGGVNIAGFLLIG